MVPGDPLTGGSTPSTSEPPGPEAPRPDGGRVVLLAGPGSSTDMVANYLAASGVPDLVVIVEDAQPRAQMARRRARRVGWLPAVGQVLFVVFLQPLLERQSKRRRAAILGAASLDATHRTPSHRVPSVNDDVTVALLASLRPDVVVVHGTRIIATRVLEAAGCPIVNMHAGITLRYRGVHGGYWALVERHPEWVGTTVHLVDPGIDTGGILAQRTFGVSPDDSFATYPDLHLVHGLPLLADQVAKALAGTTLRPVPASLAPGSGFYYHPTLWGYLWSRWRRGVR
jgi:folate-dependent phosphoribosylglycinamide formyltransferase PurN